MDESRRKFFGIGAAVAASLAIPAAAVAVDKTASEAVGPIMFEHTCDGGSSRYTPAEIAEMKESWPTRYVGCGTKFRWYFGTASMCPNCGFHYLVTIEDVKNNFYRRVSG